MRRKRKTPFEKWWCDPKRKGLLPLSPTETPYDWARQAFEAGRASVPTSKAMRKALCNLLDLLDNFDSGFDGFGEVNEAERLLNRPLSRPR